MKEAIAAETVVAESPKTKKGTKTEVEPSAEPKAPRKAKMPANTKYRLINGVDPSTFRGQRQIVVKALQTLGPGHHSIEAIVPHCESLVSKTPVEASVRYHLKGLLEDGKVEALEPEAPAPAVVEKTV